MRRNTSKGGQTVSRFGGQTLSVALLLLTGYPSHRLTGQDLANNSGALFLVLPVGAQAVGMGQTAAALEGRGEAAFWNPAGLATLERDEVAFNTASLAAGATHALTAYFPSHGLGVLGGSVYLVDYGDLARTDSSSNTVGRISPRNFEFLASYATVLAGSFSFGVNYKLVEFVVDCSGDCTGVPSGRGVTHAIDIGGQVAVGPTGALRVGVAVRNVGFRLRVNKRDQPDALPPRLVVGPLYRVALPRPRPRPRPSPRAAACGCGPCSRSRCPAPVSWRRTRIAERSTLRPSCTPSRACCSSTTKATPRVTASGTWRSTWRGAPSPRRGATPCSSTTKRWSASRRAGNSTAIPSPRWRRRRTRRPSTARCGCWHDAPSGRIPMLRPIRARPHTRPRSSSTSSTPSGRHSAGRGATLPRSSRCFARRSARAITPFGAPRATSACCWRTTW